MFNDEDFFDGSPQSKCMDIIFNANRDVSEEELDGLISRLAALELMMEEKGQSDHLDHEIMMYQQENAQACEEHKKGLYIHLMSEIVSRSG